jgi:hypothetical protein
VPQVAQEASAALLAVPAHNLSFYFIQKLSFSSTEQ